jgi:DNA-directed RNA polymerase subunit RPC12/RpoP
MMSTIAGFREVRERVSAWIGNILKTTGGAAPFIDGPTDCSPFASSCTLPEKVQHECHVCGFEVLLYSRNTTGYQCPICRDGRLIKARQIEFQWSLGQRMR